MRRNRFLLVAAFLAMIFVFGFIQSEKANAAQTVTSGECTLTLNDDGLLTVAPTDGVSGTLGSRDWYYDSIVPYYLKNDIKKVVFEDGVKAGESLENAFFDFINVTEIDLTKLDMSETNNIACMFRNCTKLEKINLLGKETGTIEMLYGLFDGCESLKEVDLSSLDFSAVLRYEGLFFGCSSLEKVVLPANGPKVDGFQGPDIDLLEGSVHPHPQPNPGLFPPVFGDCDNLNEVTFGESYEAADFVLPDIKANSKYTGEWMNKATNESKSSKEFAAKTGDLDPGTYVRVLAKKTVSFETKGGTAVKDQSVAHGEKATEPSAPTRDGGYTFKGWYLNGKKYNFDNPVKEDIVLFARWSKPATYTLTYPDGSVKTTDDLDEAKKLLNKWELVAAKLTSDELGKIMLKDWTKNAEIKIEETKIPAGYSADSTVTVTKIDEGGVTIVNPKIEKEETIVKDAKSRPKNPACTTEENKAVRKTPSSPGSVKRYGGVGTGDDSNMWLYALFMLTGLGVAVGAGRKLKTKNAKKILMLVVAAGMTISAAGMITQAGLAEEGKVDNFTINKVDQYNEPVEGAEFSIYAKPVMTVENTNVDVKKVWDDKGFEANRPEKITVDLLADNEKVDSVDLSEKNSWKHTFTDLPKYKDGEEIMYSVEERKVEGYAAKITEDGDDSFVITNSMATRVKISKSVIIPHLGEGPEVDVNLPKAEGNQAVPKQQQSEDPRLSFYKNYVKSLSLTLKDSEGKAIKTWEITGEELWNNSDEAKEKYLDEEVSLLPGEYSITESFVPKDPIIITEIFGEGTDEYYEEDSIIQNEFAHHHANIKFTVNKDGMVTIEETQKLVTEYHLRYSSDYEYGYKITNCRWETIMRSQHGSESWEPACVVALEDGTDGKTQSIKIRNYFAFLPPKWK